MRTPEDRQGSYEDISSLLFGLGDLAFFIVITVLSIPIYVFRVFVIFLAKLFRHDFGSTLDPLSSFLSCDYFSGKPPRATILVPMVFGGKFNKDEVLKIVSDRWISPKDPTTGSPLYPQFTQYPYRWLGFAFWRKESHFDLADHVHCDDEEEYSRVKSEDYVNSYNERLLNKPFKREWSPFEFHIIQNYRNPRISSGELTVITLRIHHCLADGYSILYAIYEGLFGLPRDSLVIPKARSSHSRRGVFERLFYLVSFPVKALIELFKVYTQNFVQCPWKVDDSRKAWYQLYAKSKPISKEQIKHIKNTFGVSFTSVLLSAISAGICSDFEEKLGTGHKSKRDMYFLAALPLPNKSRGNKRLINDATAAVFPVPIGSYETKVKRLMACSGAMEDARDSIIPVVSLIFYQALGCNHYRICDFLAKNRMISAGLSNFPAPPNSISLNGREMHQVDFATGALYGNSGAAFLVLSYNEYIRIAVTAENAVLSREQLERLMKLMENEIATLYSMSQNNIKT